MATLDRRTFLRRAGTALGGSVVAAGPMQGLAARAALADHRSPSPSLRGVDYGPLFPAPEATTGEELIWLPKDFQYRVFGEAGSPMTDGVATPTNHDGMASFRYRDGRIRMIRNHELLPGDDPEQVAFGTAVLEPYDPEGAGGTTTLELNGQGELLSSWVSLNGTTMNCAGGAMPWGSWISCEENISGPNVNMNFLGQQLDLTKPHGYIWEVPVSRGPGGPNRSEPIRSAGRFNHEAVAWGRDGFLYLTEDNFDGPSGFYRYRPPRHPRQPRQLLDGGTLEVLRVRPNDDVPFSDTGSADLRGKVGAGGRFRTDWVTIPDPDPTIPPGTSNTDGSRAVAIQGYEQGAANFSRIEGCWFGKGRVFFVATTGGREPTREDPFRRGSGAGQVWMYETGSGILSLIFEPDVPEGWPDENLDIPPLEGPDNITTTPQGSLLICEDSDGMNFLRGLTKRGQIFDFARTGDGIESEWAGANFSPNGRVLFVNLQDAATASMPEGLEGLTLAIWGPWGRGEL